MPLFDVFKIIETTQNGFQLRKNGLLREKKKVKIISSVDYVSLPIKTANFDDGGVFFSILPIKR